MATIDLGTPHPPTSGALEALPRRISLTRLELGVLTGCAGDAPLPFDEIVAGGRDLDGRLGPTPSSGEAAAYTAALGSLHDARSSLARRGLLVDTAADEALCGAIGLLATPALALDLDVAVDGARVKAWHRQRAGAVASLATTDGLVFELAWFSTDQWADELARVAVLPEDHPVRESALPAYVDLPFSLVDAAAEAARSNRSDLLSVLVSEHPGQTRYADGSTVPDLEVVALLAALGSEPVGRLRALVADVSTPSPAEVGVVSWALLADGWRALRPWRTEGLDRVEVAAVSPADLANELAPVLAEVAA